MKTVKKKLAPKRAKLTRKVYFSFPNLSPAVQGELVFLSMLMTHLWNIGCDQVKVWKEMEKEDPRKKPLTAFSFNTWISEIKEDTTFQLNGPYHAIPMSMISVDLMRQLFVKLVGSWQSFFALRKNGDTEALPPREQKEYHFLALSWSSFSLKRDELGRTCLVLPGIRDRRIWIPIDGRRNRYLRKGLQGKDIKYVTISRTSKGFKLNVIVATPQKKPKSLSEVEFVRAVDLGAGDIAVADSNRFEYLIPARRPDKYWRKKIKQVEKATGKCAKGSRRYRRLMKARQIMHAKSREQHKDFQRKLAHSLVPPEGVDLIIIGKSRNRLGLARSTKGTADQHWGAQNTGFLFQQLLFIKEKAQERGVRVIELDDPPRQGAIFDKEVKLIAARALLRQGVKKTMAQYPTSDIFCREKFKFVQ
jgi:transposase